MSQPQFRIPPPVHDALKESGLQWRVRPGRKHAQLWVAGIFLAVFSYGRNKCETGGRHNANTVAAIKRLSRKIHHEAV